MSAFTAQKAQNLVDTNAVTRISDESYDVKSSNDTPYLISNEICTCVGFKYRGECSHILAVKLHKSLPTNISGNNTREMS